jgi:hypothetical protein
MRGTKLRRWGSAFSPLARKQSQWLYCEADEDSSNPAVTSFLFSFGSIAESGFHPAGSLPSTQHVNNVAISLDQVLATYRASSFRSTLTCCVMQRATNRPTTDRTPGRSSYLGHRNIQHTTYGLGAEPVQGFLAGLTINPVRTALLRGSNSAIRLILKEIRNFRGLGLQPHPY